MILEDFLSFASFETRDCFPESRSSSLFSNKALNGGDGESTGVVALSSITLFLVLNTSSYDIGF